MMPSESHQKVVRTAKPRKMMLVLLCLAAPTTGLRLVAVPLGQQPVAKQRRSYFFQKKPRRTSILTQLKSSVFESAAEMFGGMFEPDPETLRAQPKWLSKVRGVSKYADKVNAIEALGPATAALSDSALKAKTDEFRARNAKGESLDDLLIEAFAVCREASKRVLGLYHYDVQLCGGIALHEGKLAEMATGEGKTLVATLPLYLRALDATRVTQQHLVTVNDYLARRDAEILGPLYEFLGLTVGVVQGSSDTRARREAYACDVTYVTNNELGFDYLRDHLCFDERDLTVTARPLSFAIVDEADSILVDESRTPLIVSSPADEDEEEMMTQKYAAATEVARYLKKNRDYDVDYKAKRVILTDRGYETACEVLGTDDLFDAKTKWAVFLQPALNAKECYLKERDYIVDSKKNEVIIVDEFTGRIMEGRRWNGGLHQAVESKENVPVKPESVTSASITYQSLFLLYKTLSGMTGTAKTEAKELAGVFPGLEVISIPTAKPMRRDDRDDLVYATKLAKFRAVLRDVSNFHAEGRPVLVGTVTVEDSSLISELLENENIPHRVLNAKPDVAQRESEIVAQAGRKSAVTIATNMAGRGTDILLGGNAQLFAKIAARQQLAPKVDDQLRALVASTASEKASFDFFPTQLSADAKKLLEDASSEAASVLLDAERQALAALGGQAFFDDPNDGEQPGSNNNNNNNNPEEESSGTTTTTTTSTSASVAPPPGWSRVDADESLPAKLARVDDFIAQSVAAAARAEFDKRTGIVQDESVENDEAKQALILLGQAVKKIEDEFTEVVEKERDVVRELGGLVVLGTERHESRRIDLQLRGRAGRQGDAGESVFAISLEDKMFNIFGADKMKQLRMAFDFAGDADEPLSSGMLSKSLATIQEKVENFYRDMRGQLYKYDKIIDAQRRIFYRRRQNVLRANRTTLEDLVSQYCVDTARDVLANASYALSKNTNRKSARIDGTPDDVASIAVSQIQLMFPRAADAVRKTVDEFVADKWAAKNPNGQSFLPAAGATVAINLGELEVALAAGVRRAVGDQLDAIQSKQDDDEDLPAAVMRFLILREFDRGWRGHLQDLELLREVVGFEAFSQKDPFNEWVINSNDAFKQLSANIYRFSAISFLSLDPDTALVKQPVLPSPRRAGAGGPPDADAVVDVVSGPFSPDDARLSAAAAVSPGTQEGATTQTLPAAANGEQPKPAGNRAARRAQKKSGRKSRRQRG